MKIWVFIRLAQVLIVITIQAAMGRISIKVPGPMKNPANLLLAHAKSNTGGTVRANKKTCKQLPELAALIRAVGEQQSYAKMAAAELEVAKGKLMEQCDDAFERDEELKDDVNKASAALKEALKTFEFKFEAEAPKKKDKETIKALKAKLALLEKAELSDADKSSDENESD